MIYTCWDSSGERVEVEADDPDEAARVYVDAGVWEVGDTTTWVTVHVEDDEGDLCSIPVGVDPDEPDCSEEKHEYGTPYDIVGGLKDNPGVWGHGGGVLIVEVCAHCGLFRVTDTWAQNPETGQQGLISVQYTKSWRRGDVS